MQKSSSSASPTTNPFADPPSRAQTDIELGEITSTMQHHHSPTAPNNCSGSGNKNKASIWARTTSSLRAISFADVIYSLHLLHALSGLLAAGIYAGAHAHDHADEQGTASCQYGPYRNADGSLPDAAAWVAAWAIFTVVAGYSAAVLQAIVSGGPRSRGQYPDSTSQEARGLSLYRGLALVAGWFFGLLIVVVGVCAYLQGGPQLGGSRM